MKNIIILLFLFLVKSVSAQTTFNKRYHFDRPLAVLTNIIASDTGYVFLGITVPETPPYYTSSVFGYLNLEGEVIYTNKEDGNGQELRVWRDNFLMLNDTSYAVWGAVSDTVYQTALYFYNEAGEITGISRYEHFIAEDLQRIPKDMIYMDNYFYTIESLENNNNQNNFDFGLSKINLAGERILTKIIGHPTRSDIPHSIIIAEDGGLLIGGRTDNFNLAEEGFQYQNYIVKLDTAGVIEWQYRSHMDSMYWAVEDMITSPGGGIIFATGKGEEQQNTLVLWQHYINKINANQQLEWSTPLRDTVLRTIDSYFTHLVEASDNSGYIGVGFSEFPQDDLLGWNTYAYLAKVSPEGDSLWSRRHQYILDSNEDWHIIYDAKATPDGGFILVGEATDRLADTLFQQAWVLKLDEYGCLVPDCHLADTTSTYEPDTWQGRILLYPNPVKDYLNLFFKTQENIQDMTCSIVNQQGQVLKRFQPSANEVTMMVDVNQYAAGQYYLILEKDGRVLWQEGFIKVD